MDYRASGDQALLQEDFWPDDDIISASLGSEALTSVWTLESLPEASEPKASASSLALRCLDPAHAEGCALCTPPPSAGQENLFELRGGVATSKEGEKVSPPTDMNAMTSQWGVKQRWPARPSRPALSSI